MSRMASPGSSGGTQPRTGPDAARPRHEPTFRPRPIDWARFDEEVAGSAQPRSAEASGAAAGGEAAPVWMPDGQADIGRALRGPRTGSFPATRRGAAPGHTAAFVPSPPASGRPALSAPERVLQRLDWTVVRRLDGLLQGEYRGLFRGNGIDFAGLREYQPGDDVRYIDWNVTARTATTYVREYNEDREITAWFLLDLSPSVDFGTAATARLKRTVLVDFVGTLGRLLTRRGNRVGAMVLGSSIERLPPRSGREQVLRLIDTLEHEPRQSRAPLTDLEPLLSSAEHAIRRRSMVFLVSDFIATPGWERPLTLLNRRHEVVAVQLIDPRETELPSAGPLLLEDSETGEQMLVDTGDRRFRQRFESAVRERQDRISAAFRTAGVDAHTLSTEDDLVRAIVRMATLRSRRRR